MLKKAILYPITKENEILLRYSSLLEQVKIIGGLLLDESIDESYSNAMVGLKEIDRYDTVIIGDGTILENSNEKKIIDLIYNVVNYKKDIIILYQLNQEQYELICMSVKKWCYFELFLVWMWKIVIILKRFMSSIHRLY